MKRRQKRKRGRSSGTLKMILAAVIVFILFIIAITSIRGCSDICSNGQHQLEFTQDGEPCSTLKASHSDTLNKANFTNIRFFMESSGSMNGFLRAGVPTDFKGDVWAIMNYYARINPTITPLSTDTSGQLVGGKYNLASFQTPFNNGGFVSAVSTNLPEMLRYICEHVDVNREVAVFISDMQFDPVGSAAPNVLQLQYCTDVAEIFGNFKNAVALVGAKSNYVYRNGTTLTDAPYYFVIFGKSENVASVRNDISEFLTESNKFIDNIETGFNYHNVPYEFGDNYSNCLLKDNYSSVYGIEGDSCQIELLLHLENYRWNLSDKDILSKSLSFKMVNGAKIKIASINYDIQVKDQSSKDLNRKVTAHVILKVSGMHSDCDMIKWKLDIPCTEYTAFSNYFTNQPNNPSLTYSLKSFIKGMFYNGTVSHWYEGYNYIHISKK